MQVHIHAHLQCQAPGSIWNRSKSPPGALPEVRLHWEHESARERGRDSLLRCRMNFLPLLHCATGSGSSSKSTDPPLHQRGRAARPGKHTPSMRQP